LLGAALVTGAALTVQDVAATSNIKFILNFKILL
jgi:hypothetical protein